MNTCTVSSTKLIDLCWEKMAFLDKAKKEFVDGYVERVRSNIIFPWNRTKEKALAKIDSYSSRHWDYWIMVSSFDDSKRKLWSLLKMTNLATEVVLDQDTVEWLDLVQ